MRTVDEVMYYLNILKLEYGVLLEQQERLIKVLKPFAFDWQNKQMPTVGWERYYNAHLALVDIMDKDEYLKEAEDAR